jgi:hypothetical protein
MMMKMFYNIEVIIRKFRLVLNDVEIKEIIDDYYSELILDYSE